MTKSKKPAKFRQQKTLNLLPKIQLLFGLILILAGASLLIANALHKVNLNAKSAHHQAAISPQEIATKPAKIYIPKMKRTLAVSDGYYIDNRWTVAETGVSYYTNSAIPGHGNSVLYGHNRKGLLGGLWRVDSGDYIYLILANGHFVKYQVSEEKEIKPTQVEILAQTADSRLTLYTCSGFLDTARFVVVGNQVESTI